MTLKSGSSKVVRTMVAAHEAGDRVDGRRVVQRHEGYEVGEHGQGDHGDHQGIRRDPIMMSSRAQRGSSLL